MSWADTVTLSYSGSTTTNMTGNNDAASVGLSATEWSVVGSKGSANNFPGLNKAGQIRLYYHASGSNSITVSSLAGATINSITATYGASNNNAVVTVGSNTVADTNDEAQTGEYDINSSSFTIRNGYTSNVQLYILSIVIDYTPATPAYTITAQSNNNSYGTVSLSGSVIAATPASGYTYADPAYTVSPDGSATVAQEGDNFTVTPSANTTVTINFAAIPTYTVTLSDDTGNPLTEASAGAGVTLPSRSAVGSYTFAGWSATNVDSETTTAPALVGEAGDTYYPTANITLYPVYTRTEGGGETTSDNIFSSGSFANDIITWSIDNVVSIKQEQNSGNTAPNSSYVNAPRWYSGNKITITPSVSINSITVTANTETYATTLASSTYTNASASASNTSVTITPDNGSSAITIEMSGQSRLSSLTINYSNSTTYYISTPSAQERVALPSITIPDGAFVSTKMVTITTETAGASIQYSTDGGTNWTDYSAPFSINATTTVQAKATKTGMTDSNVAEATFTKETVLVGLSALVANINTSDATYYVNLTDAQVTWANEKNGYMEDANAGVYMYNVTPTANLVYNGIFSVTYQLYNSMPEIKSITAVEGSTAAGSAKAATVMTTSALDAAFDANLGRQIQINGFTVPQGKTLTDNINLYEASPYTSVTAGTTYNLVGYPFYAKVSGTVTKQFRITSAVEKVLIANAIAGINDTYTVDLANNEDEVDLSGATATSGATVQYTVTSSTIGDSDYVLTSGVLTVSSNGVITVRAYVDADEDYNGAEKVVTITVIDEPVIGYADENESTAYGTPYTVDTDLIDGGDATLSSSNTNVATVSGLTITPVAVGSTTITINTAATDIWHAGTATFTLNVTAPTGSTTAPSGVVTTTFTNKNLEYSEGGIDWTASIDANQFEALRGVQFGAAKGEFTLTHTNTQKVKKVGFVMSTNGTGNTIAVQVGSTSFENNDDTSVTLTNGMSNEELEFTGEATGNIVVSCSDANKSIYFKSITVEFESSITATLNGSGYATFCSQYPLDFSDYATADYSAWQVTGVSGDKITFEQITGSVKGGTGILLMGTAGATVTLNSVASSNTLSTNKLVGTLAPTYVAADEFYGLSGNEFVKVNAGTVPAGKALLSAAEVGGVKALSLEFEGTDGISETVKSEKMNNAIYDLSGRRVVKPTKGLYIVNGKKIVK